MKPYGGHKEMMKCGCQNHPGKHIKPRKKRARQEGKRSWVDDLDELLDENDIKVTFDPYRDNTKGCGEHCKAWAVGDSQEYCENHKKAIKEGNYKLE